MASVFLKSLKDAMRDKRVLLSLAFAAGCLLLASTRCSGTGVSTEVEPKAPEVLAAPAPLQSSGSATTTPCGLYDFFVAHNEGALAMGVLSPRFSFLFGKVKVGCSQGPGIHKWAHYFPVYEEHFSRFCTGTQQIRMVELGIQSGGSMLMWRHAFGERLKILVGMDINPKTRAWERFGSNVKVEIGSQADPEFLQSISSKYPEGFDIIIDDGSHVPEHIFITFVKLWPSLRPGGVFIIEDVHGTAPVLHWLLHGHSTTATSSSGQTVQVSMSGLYWPGEAMGPADQISQGQGDFLGNWNGQTNLPASNVQREVESIKVYPYMIAITRRASPLDRVYSENHGSQWIPY